MGQSDKVRQRDRWTPLLPRQASSERGLAPLLLSSLLRLRPSTAFATPLDVQAASECCQQCSIVAIAHGIGINLRSCSLRLTVGVRYITSERGGEAVM